MTAGIAGRGFFTDDASFIHVVFQEGHAAMLALSSRQMWGLSAQLRFLGIILQLSFSPLNKQPWLWRSRLSRADKHEWCGGLLINGLVCLKGRGNKRKRWNTKRNGAEMTRYGAGLIIERFHYLRGFGGGPLGSAVFLCASFFSCCLSESWLCNINFGVSSHSGVERRRGEPGNQLWWMSAPVRGQRSHHSSEERWRHFPTTGPRDLFN